MAKPEITVYGAHWCPDCQSSVNIIAGPVCNLCGGNLATERVCWQCEIARPKVSALRSWALYDGPVRNAIHRLK